MVEDQFTGFVDRRDAQDGSRLFGQHLPWHDVRVVLHGRQKNFIALTDMGCGPVGLCHQIDGFRGPANEHNFFRIGRSEEALHLLPRAFVRLRGPEREGMRPAMDVRVVPAVELSDGVDHALWFLCGCGIVQPDERLAIDRLMQRGEIPANGFNIQNGQGRTEA